MSTTLGAGERSRPPTGNNPALLEFERERLALFARYGFDGESRWVADREGDSVPDGRGEGPSPTLLIHGGLSQASEWSLLAGRIPGHVIIPDRPGCGLSYRVDYGSVPDFRKAAADWMLDLADGFGVDQFDVVGNSMGGFFAMAFAIAHPDRVHRLVLVGSPAGASSGEPPASSASGPARSPGVSSPG
jgi:2-hydroxy-6-oxonona-2,4-dienedioate hydrolase